MQAGIERELKPDGTIVTAADRAVETMLREELPSLGMDAGTYGEEFGGEPERADGLWCLDPIDGTSNYGYGSPLWGISIGLVQGEQAMLGAVFLPQLGEMYLAALGAGATMNGGRLPPIPSGVIRPEELVSYPDRVLRKHGEQEIPGKMRHTGAFIVDAAFACAQRYRGLVGMREKLYDVAGSLCIAREVGADVRYADGRALELEPLKQPGARLEKAWLIFPPGSDFRL